MSLPRLSSALRTLTEISQSPRPFIPTRIRYRPIPNARTRFASSLASEPSSSGIRATRIRTPTPKDLEEVDLDPDTLVNGEEASIGITSRAAEQLRNISVQENDQDLALRLIVESGGCHGYQYKMELTAKSEPDDYQFQHATLQPSRVVVDAVSMGLLKGSTLDFATELIGSSFRVIDNPQAKGSGCGCGVSWEANI